jgi:FAD/FMN-containing dehydrogenase
VRSHDELRKAIDGRLFEPADNGYDAARRPWNLAAGHRPAVVVVPGSAEDIRLAVLHAKASGLGVGVMATGHGTGLPSDGGLLLNTSELRGVTIDPAARVARVEAGAIWQDVISAAAVHGLASLPGSSPRVGVVGYTLGGGFGWLGRRYGLAAHSVLRAEIVTADGAFTTASAEHNPDLFWAIRGGTGNFGVVTALEFRLHPVREVYAGNLYYPLERARDVLEFFTAWSPRTPDDLTAAVTFRRFPPLAGLPTQLRGRTLVAVRGCFSGDHAAGVALIDGARKALGTADFDTFDVLPVADLASVSMDPIDPLPAHSHSEMIPNLTPDVIDALIDLAGPDSGSPLVMLELRQLGGALTGSPDMLSPMAHSTAVFSLNAIGVTPTPEATAAVQQHLRWIGQRLQGLSTGETYLNFLDLDGATADRVRAAYSAADWNRLVTVKRRYDPGNLFRFNRAIPTDSAAV